MNIQLTLPESATDYIRHARLESLKAVGDAVRPELIEPAPFASYLLAREEAAKPPVGMAEFAFYDQVYPSFEGAEYPASFRLDRFGPFESFVGTRTLYVEPGARRQIPPYYLLLAMAGCRYAFEAGARFTTASTNAADPFLTRLYKKTGGVLVGTYRDTTHARFEIAVFVFELERIIAHPAMRRLEGNLEIDPEIASTVRARNAWDDEFQCA